MTSGYYDDNALFRVVTGRWAQFGISGTPATAQAWRSRTVRDDPFVGQKNVKGAVVAGLDAMDALYDGYGESALGGIRAGKQDVLFTQGNAYLRKHFPMLDYIRKATVE